MYSIYIQKSKCYIVPLYDCKFWQLEGADPIYTVYIWKPSKLQRLLFQNNDREIQDTFRFLRIIACLQIAVEEDNDSLKKRMSTHKPHSSSLSDCVCNCVLEHICGKSDMSEMYVLWCIMCPDTSKPGQLSQVTNQFISWCCNSATRYFYSTLYNALHKEKYETNLHQTPSSYKRLLIQRFSPDCLQRQLLTHSPWAFWCPARHHFHASFGRKHVASPRPLHGVLETRQRLLTATYNIGVQCRIYSVRLKSYLKKCNGRIMKCLHNFILTTLSALKQIQDKTALHLQCCQVCWHQKLKETNMSCTWTGLQLAFWPLSPMAASETSHTHKFSQSIHNSASQISDALDALD